MADRVIDFYDLIEKIDDVFHETGEYASADEIAKAANYAMRRDMAPSWHVKDISRHEEFEIAVLFDGLNPLGGDDVEFGSRFRFDIKLSDLIVEEIHDHTSNGNPGAEENASHFASLKLAVDASLGAAAKKLGL